MIKIDMLRCFSTVAQFGTLSEAALRLGRTQSALSMTLKQLEEHLGARLFETERKNKLTPLGQEVFRLAQQQLRQFDDTVHAIEAASNAPRGLLRIASIPSAASLALPDAIAALMQTHPHLKVDLRDMDSEMVAEAMLHGQADLGITSRRQPLTGTRQEVLFEDSFGLLCGVKHPLAGQENPTFEDVFGANFIRNNLCDHIEHNAVKAALQNANLTVHNTHSLIAMVRTHEWVTILPQSVARALPSELTFKSIHGLCERRTVSLLISERTRFPDLVDDFAMTLRHCDWTVPGSSAAYAS
ncbi:LysR family transcriptional regulator [Shimia haliotis]|uniref:Transcriptional regulator, LysR family n=1 Tax=Shimia haliotis TaxID=1280847 RepID=A0A1I4AAW8_9RHOB|nr:LysR family transcriptional regulator [Shimia haliotis]SFK53548.1 transcriptional regulator, LysR family [Shimia haliotis]